MLEPFIENPERLMTLGVLYGYELERMVAMDLT